MPYRKYILFCLTLTLLYWKQLYAQSTILTGTIVNDENKPVLGAVVAMSTRHEGDDLNRSHFYSQTISNAEGNFSIKVPEADKLTISVRHLAYATQFHDVEPGENEMQIMLKEQVLALDEIIISSLKNEKALKKTSIPTEALTSNQWERWNPRDLSEVLELMPGVNRTSDGVWANSVNIRGFGEDRTVRLIDGNRIETATDLAGALSTVDVSDIERVEVIKSGISSLYGSGAMGGAINIITKKASYSTNRYVHGSLSMEYQSVNQMWAPRASVFAGSSRWNAKLHFGYRNANDAQSPAETIQNSAFSDWNVSGRIAFRTFDMHELSLDYQKYEGSAGIPGGDVLPNNATANYQDFDRELIAFNYEIVDLSPSLTLLKAKYFRQNILRNVTIQPNAPPKTANGKRITAQLLNPSARHLTNGGLIESHWRFARIHSLVVGWDLWQRQLESQRTRHILQEVFDTTGAVIQPIAIIKGETPIPTSTFTSSGLFAQYDVAISQRLDLALGGRLDWITLSNQESRDPDYLINQGELIQNPPGQIIVHPASSSSNNTWAINAGVSYAASKDVSLSFAYGRSYRAPSLEERYKYINLGHTVELGNPDLVPEEGNFIDAGIKLLSKRIQLTGNVFLNYVNKLITMAQSDSVTFLLGDESGYSQKVFTRKYQNIDEALLTGFDVNLDWQVYAKGVAYAQASFVYGVDRSTGAYLPQIMPVNGMLGFRQKVPRIGRFDVRTRMFGAQDKVAEGEVPSEAYALLDFSFESQPLPLNVFQIKFSLGVDNVLNTEYRNHLSTNRGIWIAEPGRNVRAKLFILW